MKILTFDTCLEKMYVAIGDERGLLASKTVETTQNSYHSAFLISTVKEMLKGQNLTPRDVSLVATNIGPGSFTGIRACVTVARVLAQALDIDALGVSSLEVISKIAPKNNEKPVLVALDARKEMAYVGIYDKNSVIQQPKAVLISELKEIVNSGDYFVITDDKMSEHFGGISYQSENHDFGAFLYEIALKKSNSENLDWKKLLPLYIQPPALHVKKSEN